MVKGRETIKAKVNPHGNGITEFLTIILIILFLG
jgi:hypothetical protein